jgi:hypothetical protein
MTASAAVARADSILYRCFPNLCRVAPDGSGAHRVTRDGAMGGPVYGWLSASARGTRLGVSYGNRAFVLSASGRRLYGPLPHGGGAVLVTQISPDGSRIATIETIGESIPPPLRFVPYLFLARADGSGRDTVARSTAATAWLGDRLLRDEAADSSPFVQQICLLAAGDDFPCERLVASDPEHDLWDPAVSPDRRLLAVTRAPVDSTRARSLSTRPPPPPSSGCSPLDRPTPSRAGRPTAARSCSRAATAVSGWCAPAARPARSDGSSAWESSPSGWAIKARRRD